MSELLQYQPRTKIVCTLGPASRSDTILRKLVREGLDIVRVNFAHGTRDDHAALIRMVREVNAALHRHIRILCDLEGPRIRLGGFPDDKPVELPRRGKVWLVPPRRGRGNSFLPLDYDGSFLNLEGARHLYLDDGRIVLETVKVSADVVETRVLVGGLLWPRKVVTMPGARLSLPVLSDRDRRDIGFAVEQGLDFIVQSGVREGADVKALRKMIGGRLPGCRILAKVENRDGVQHLDGIVDAADGILVARGDLAVWLPVHEVPLVQKEIIGRCNRARKLVITATQVLEHMVENRIPTRAEAADIANAVLDGTDAVMLSAETAVGRYPVEALRVLNQIIKHTELHAPGGLRR